MSRIIVPSQISMLEMQAKHAFAVLMDSAPTGFPQDENLAKEQYRLFWLYLNQTINPGRTEDFSSWRRTSQRAKKWDRYLLQLSIGSGAARQLGQGNLQVHAWYGTRIRHLDEKDIKNLIDDTRRWHYRFYEQIGCALMYEMRLDGLVDAMQHIRTTCPVPKSD